MAYDPRTGMDIPQSYWNNEGADAEWNAFLDKPETKEFAEVGMKIEAGINRLKGSAQLVFDQGEEEAFRRISQRISDLEDAAKLEGFDYDAYFDIATAYYDRTRGGW